MLPYIYKSATFSVGSYGVLLAIAYLIGRIVYLRHLALVKPKIENTEMLIILLLVFGVVGAKIMFILKNADKSDLLFSGTGFSSQGALLGAILATTAFSYFNKVKLSILLDNAAPAAILAYAIARIGCFLSGDDCYGMPSSLPWALSFPDGIAKTTETVHPIPIYESIYSFVIFYVLLKMKNNKQKDYAVFFTLFGLWGICRFAVEFISTNPKLLLSMSGSQFGALVTFVFSLIYFVQMKKSIH